MDSVEQNITKKRKSRLEENSISLLSLKTIDNKIVDVTSSQDFAEPSEEVNKIIELFLEFSVFNNPCFDEVPEIENQRNLIIAMSHQPFQIQN